MSRSKTETTVVQQPAAQEETPVNTNTQPVLSAQDRLRARIAFEQQKAEAKKAEMAKVRAANAAKAALPKVEKPKPLCACGCGAETGGGKFRPGHDAKLKSALFGVARGEDEQAAAAAIEELAERGWLHLMAAPKVKDTRSAAEKEDDEYAQLMSQIINS